MLQTPLPYFTPPDNLNLDHFSSLLQVMMGIIIAVGILVIVATVFFSLKHALKVITGKSFFDGKFFLWLFIGIIVGIMLMGGGWLGIISLIHNSTVNPIQNIM